MMKLNTEICNAFDKHAKDYEQAAKVQTEIGERLFERLSYLKIVPRYVLDLGCGTGIFTRLLKKKYPKATIIAFDLSQAMLRESKRKQGFLRRWPLVNGDMTQLPFVDGAFDLVFANQVIHWSNPLQPLLAELNRVMKRNGCLMFSTLGPDTFKELNQAWQGADGYMHSNQFVDMHDIGDDLLAERFLDPVVDMEFLTVHYSSLNLLVHGLKSQGVRNINQARNKGLTGKKAWQLFAAKYKNFCTSNGKYPLTYEVIYGHAWKGEQQRKGNRTETFISIENIKRSPKDSHDEKNK